MIPTTEMWCDLHEDYTADTVYKVAPGVNICRDCLNTNPGYERQLEAVPW